MRFVDEALIYVRAGEGGDGCVSFRREKFVPRGGPDGGDGGDGGSVILVGDEHLQTLADFVYRRRYQAKRGQHGMGKNRHGKSGEDVILPVPLGTDVYDAVTGEKLGEVVKPGERLIVAKGGRGGWGNTHFATPVERAPRKAEPGAPGEERTLRLVLRLLADIGLVGLPNAGKSTLLRALTAAKPKIADYPFTTIAPNLGVLDNGQVRFTVADMPGIIAGAHQGKGLGLQFLRHIERTKMILYVVDGSQGKLEQDFNLLQAELRQYNSELLKKPAVLVVNKIDLMGDNRPRINANLPVVWVSALTGTGLADLQEVIGRVFPKNNAV
ncbi:GTPase ObgE [candidate division WOR-3 bacterium]|nr:GTPase ObgE [candidate division WOR-3 bacterium]